VSLTPAATDLIVAMGASDLLKGVSTFDTDAALDSMPRVGDYESVDWERIASLGPAIMFVQSDPARLPQGLRDRAEQLGIELVVLRIERLTDIIVELDRIGVAMGRADDARELLHRIRQKLDEVRTNVAVKPGVRTLLIIGASGTSVAGRETFLDDLLGIAGGTNAVDASGYVTIDREKLVELAPDAVIQFMPDAKPGDIEEASRFWAGLPDVPAVKAGRVVTLTGTDVLKPGPAVADVAQQIAAGIHRN
jgi:iron complex transport system substrate-binding protein